jgi:hypothetical protein
MSDWQPARFKMVHDRNKIMRVTPKVRRQIKDAERRIFRCQPCTPQPQVLVTASKLECDATRFYFLHPQDTAGLPHSGEIAVACEHEVLTD